MLSVLRQRAAPLLRRQVAAQLSACALRASSLSVVASAHASSASSACVSARRCSLHTAASRLSSAPSAAAVPGSVIEFNLADIGEGIAECEVLRWFIAEGDTIAQFDKVCEVQSDKANVEITSRYDGKVVSLKYAVGELAKVGKPLLTLQLAGSSDPAVPGVGSIDVNNADMEEPRTAAAARPGLAQQLAAGELTDDARNTANDKVLSSPAVRRIAREEKVPLAQVAGTGPGGRILKEDVLNFIKNGRKPTAQAKAASSAAPTPLAYQAPPTYQAPAPAGKAAAPAAAAAAAPAAKSFAAPPQAITEDRVIPITGVNRIMVQTMTAANAVPQLGFGDEICMDALYELRTALNKEAQAKYGVKVSYMPFILKAASLALLQFPQLNAHTNADCSTVTHRAQHNLGLAMDTPRGLVVPNIKDVANKSVLEIALDMQRLAKLGAEGKLGREELTGGTFTISNIGTIGGTYLSPILVVPEVVIGALGGLQTLPRYDAQMNVKPTRVMNVSWSADHRVVDGATMARFSKTWQAYLENPASMLLHLK